MERQGELLIEVVVEDPLHSVDFLLAHQVPLFGGVEHAHRLVGVDHGDGPDVIPGVLVVRVLGTACLLAAGEAGEASHREACGGQQGEG